LKTISTDIKEKISTMGYLFVAEHLAMVADHPVTTIDSTLLKAKGHVMHKSSIEKGEIPCPGIDTDARLWGHSHTKEGWVFGYKLHLTCTKAAIGEFVVPQTAAAVYVTTTASVPDNKMYLL
jgi:hypothetical protein